MELGKLGTVDGQYREVNNPLLVPNVTTLPYGYPMNPMTFAQLIPTLRLAQLLAAAVVQDPLTINFWCTGKALAISLPSGVVVNAGYIFNALGNDVAFPTMRAKSKVICEELLRFTEIDWEMADKIYTAIEPSIP